MDMSFSLNLTQEQKLIMTQQMQLSLKVLQMSTYELKEYIEDAAEENPTIDINYPEDPKEIEQSKKIEYKEFIKYLDFDNYKHSENTENDDEISPFTFISDRLTLGEYLKNQVTDLLMKDSLKKICFFIIDNLDERGYLDDELKSISEKLSVSISKVQYALEVVQSLDPPGIGARNLKECLKIQLKKNGIADDKLNTLIENYLEMLADNKFNLVAKELSVDVKKVQEYVDIIKKMEPKPSRGFYTGEETKYIFPDAYLRKIDDEYVVIMNDDLLPKLRINDIYKEIIINNSGDKYASDYVKEKISSAINLIKSIEQRKSTIYKVLYRIIEIQQEYFQKGRKYLKTMTLKDVADAIGMHESTVSRAVKDKYINTQRGTIRIKDLFTTAIANQDNNEEVSASIIKEEIKLLIDKEDKFKPLSDQQICDLLTEKGMNISRRTVAKYREELDIRSSSKRKRF